MQNREENEETLIINDRKRLGKSESLSRLREKQRKIQYQNYHTQGGKDKKRALRFAADVLSSRYDALDNREVLYRAFDKTCSRWLSTGFSGQHMLSICFFASSHFCHSKSLLRKDITSVPLLSFFPGATQFFAFHGISSRWLETIPCLDQYLNLTRIQTIYLRPSLVSFTALLASFRPDLFPSIPTMEKHLPNIIAGIENEEKKSEVRNRNCEVLIVADNSDEMDKENLKE